MKKNQGTNCTGKMAKKDCLSGKTQGIWFSNFVNSLILKVKHILILIFPAKISKHFQVCQISFVSAIITNHVNWHRENLRLDRENAI